MRRALSSRDILAAQPVLAEALQFLSEPGYEGAFVFKAGNYSAEVTADPTRTNYVAPARAPDGSAGAWVRHTASVVAANLQPLDSDLTALASLGITAAGLALLDDADNTAQRATLGLGTAAVLSTSDIDERARDAVGTALVQGTGITITPNDGGDTITIAANASAIKPTESIIIAASDETTALAAGTAKVTIRMPYAFTVSAVYASLTTAQTSGSIFTVDINEGGTSILSTKLTIDNAEDDSDTAATPAVISDTSLAHRAKVTVDIDQIGDGTAKGLKVTLVGTRT